MILGSIEFNSGDEWGQVAWIMTSQLLMTTYVFDQHDIPSQE